MPCARPPCTCPATIIGLMIRPKSSDAVKLTIVSCPVSGSISISAMWAPDGKVKFFGS
ncbi:hypothetical protein D3C83_258740 [compost metagenome]